MILYILKILLHIVIDKFQMICIRAFDAFLVQIKTQRLNQMQYQ